MVPPLARTLRFRWLERSLPHPESPSPGLSHVPYGAVRKGFAHRAGGRFLACTFVRVKLHHTPRLRRRYRTQKSDGPKRKDGYCRWTLYELLYNNRVVGTLYALVRLSACASVDSIYSPTYETLRRGPYPERER